MAMQKYKGSLGEFQYDDNDFVFFPNEGSIIPYLKYVGIETEGDKIEIPHGIKSCDHMFESNRDITSMPEIPDTVESMFGTFENCVNLESADRIPGHVKITHNMFKGCESLKTAPVIEEGVKFMDGMFADCTSLEHAPVIPESAAHVYDTFEGCSKSVQKEGRWMSAHPGHAYEDRYNPNVFDEDYEEVEERYHNDDYTDENKINAEKAKAALRYDAAAAFQNDAEPSESVDYDK